jgi:hypothetical protein
MKTIISYQCEVCGEEGVDEKVIVECEKKCNSTKECRHPKINYKSNHAFNENDKLVYRMFEFCEVCRYKIKYADLLVDTKQNRKKAFNLFLKINKDAKKKTIGVKETSKQSKND